MFQSMHVVFFAGTVKLGVQQGSKKAYFLFGYYDVMPLHLHFLCSLGV
jgi:hypothetical protein